MLPRAIRACPQPASEGQEGGRNPESIDTAPRRSSPRICSSGSGFPLGGPRRHTNKDASPRRASPAPRRAPAPRPCRRGERRAGNAGSLAQEAAVDRVAWRPPRRRELGEPPDRGRKSGTSLRSEGGFSRLRCGRHLPGSGWRGSLRPEPQPRPGRRRSGYGCGSPQPEGALTSSAGPAVGRRLSLQPTAGPGRVPMLFKGAAAASESWLRPSSSLQPRSRAEARARAPPAPPRAPPPAPPRPHSGPAPTAALLPRARPAVRSSACPPAGRSLGHRGGRTHNSRSPECPGFHKESEEGQRVNCGGSAQKSAVPRGAGHALSRIPPSTTCRLTPWGGGICREEPWGS